MANSGDIKWFRNEFGPTITKIATGTPFDTAMLTALACQETGELWSVMRHKKLTATEVATLCCGDTLDSDKGRKAFPKTKADLIAHPKGDDMFDIARAALLAMATHVPAYKFAFNKPNKFCHGFGVFQYDLQFFKTSPNYFLSKEYEKFDNSLARALSELKACLVKAGLKQNVTSVTDLQFAHVAIAYNTGKFNPEFGLRQGHQSGGRYYGEWIYHYVSLARSIEKPTSAGFALISEPFPQTAQGQWFVVDTAATSLRLRSEPKISKPESKNVIVELPDGSSVRSLTGTTVGKFIEVETALGGATFRGFCSTDYLRAEVTPGSPAPAVPLIPEAHLAGAAGQKVERIKIAGAHSLNETNMPQRQGSDANELKADLHTIIAYLSPDKSSHKRYLPRSGLTFCNIYIHDYCHLSGCYLPRVWWTAPAIVRLANGEKVKPLYGNTVFEARANDLFRWFRDFGSHYGWRQAVSVTELQEMANEGAVCCIVARRKQDGRSGHIVAVVPETEDHVAKRDASGKVSSPVQSQAGVRNFNYGTPAGQWWLGAQFAESAFWVHA